MVQQPTPQPIPETPDAQAAPAPEAGGRPEWLDPKFKDGSQLQAAYNELSSRMGSEGLPPAPVDTPAPTAAPVAGETPVLQGIPETPDPAAATADVFSDEAVARYTESVGATGDITPEDRAALEAVGLPKAQIDNYIAGFQAQRQLATQSVLSVCGGEEAYGKMVQWAAANIPAGEQAAFNAALNSGDVNSATAAVRGLYAQYNSAAGNPMAVRGQAAPLSGYQNQDQLRADQRDPRYQTDPAFRDQVLQKLQASPNLL